MMRKKNNFSTIIVVIVIICIIGFISKACNSSNFSSGTVRCWYCSKVIYYNGRAIHCTNTFNNSYKCDYCGTTNVVK